MITTALNANHVAAVPILPVCEFKADPSPERQSFSEIENQMTA